MKLDIININTKAYLFLTLAALFWSGNFIVGKVASTYEIPPFSLNFYRWFFAFLILFPSICAFTPNPLGFFRT